MGPDHHATRLLHNEAGQASFAEFKLPLWSPNKDTDNESVRQSKSDGLASVNLQKVLWKDHAHNHKAMETVISEDENHTPGKKQ